MSRSDDMAALRNQVKAGHSDRQAERRGRIEFVATLTNSGVKLHKLNQGENKERKRRLMEAFVAYNKRRAGYERSRKQEANRLHNTRARFIASLARSVAALRKANSTENAAAYVGWFGAAMAAESPKRSGA